MLAFEGKRKAVWFEGNCEGCKADRKKCFGAAAEQLHRTRDKSLMRG
jgi:hypothetical protein